MEATTTEQTKDDQTALLNPPHCEVGTNGEMSRILAGFFTTTQSCLERITVVCVLASRVGLHPYCSKCVVQ